MHVLFAFLPFCLNENKEQSLTPRSPLQSHPDSRQSRANPTQPRKLTRKPNRPVSKRAVPGDKQKRKTQPSKQRRPEYSRATREPVRRLGTPSASSFCDRASFRVPEASRLLSAIVRRTEPAWEEEPDRDQNPRAVPHMESDPINRSTCPSDGYFSSFYSPATCKPLVFQNSGPISGHKRTSISAILLTFILIMTSMLNLSFM